MTERTTGKLNKIKALPNDITGRTFRTGEGARDMRFKVLNGEYWPAETIGAERGTHRRYLNGLPKGLLVSIWFLAPVPVITVDGGVYRLHRVEIDGEEFESPTDISNKLGIGKESMKEPVGLFQG